MPTALPQAVTGAVTGAVTWVPEATPLPEPPLVEPVLCVELLVQVAPAWPRMPTALPQAVTGAVTGAVTWVPEATEWPLPEPPELLAVLDDDEWVQDADDPPPSTPTALPQTVIGTEIGAVTVLCDATCEPEPLDPEPLLLVALDEVWVQPAAELDPPTLTDRPQTVIGMVIGAVTLLPDAVPLPAPPPVLLVPPVVAPEQEAEDPPPSTFSALPQTVIGIWIGATTELPEPVSALARPAPSRANPPVSTATSRVRRRIVRMRVPLAVRLDVG
jgi:hypothetical protein